MSGSSIFSENFNWATTLKLAEEKIEQRKAKELEILRKRGKIIETCIQESLEAGQPCYEFRFEPTFTHEMINLFMQDLSDRFPRRVYFQDVITKKYILLGETMAVPLGCKDFKVDLK